MPTINKLKEIFPDLCGEMLHKAMKQTDMNHAVDFIMSSGKDFILAISCQCHCVSMELICMCRLTYTQSV